MPVTLHDFIHAAGRRGEDIAGYLEPGERTPRVATPDEPRRFPYWRSSNAMLPAFVNCLEDGGDMRRVYTSHERAPWVRPRGPGVKRRDVLRPDEGDGSLIVEPVPMTTRRWPARVATPDGPAPLPGGLHAAALSHRTAANGGGGADDTSGLVRALRLYALATRTLVAASAASGFAGVHDHVGALLVGDDGAILAAGINSGSYRHAEVSLLLSWFRDRPEARALPPKSIVFSTLTPCRQCTRYLSLAKAPDTLILFDEADAGRSGRVGERIAERLEADGEPESGRTSTVSEEQTPVSAEPVDADAVRGTSYGDGIAREAERRQARNVGAGGASRIERAREARRLILEAAGPIDETASRAPNRNRTREDRARHVEAPVSTYLARWIPSAARIV